MTPAVHNDAIHVETGIDLCRLTGWDSATAALTVFATTASGTSACGIDGAVGCTGATAIGIEGASDTPKGRTRSTIKTVISSRCRTDALVFRVIRSEMSAKA